MTLGLPLRMLRLQLLQVLLATLRSQEAFKG